MIGDHKENVDFLFFLAFGFWVFRSIELRINFLQICFSVCEWAEGKAIGHSVFRLKGGFLVESF